MKYNDQAILNNIYDKTKELLTIRGVKGWNMDQLAKESGLAKNTLYKIIGSKENVIIEVISRDIRIVCEQIEDLLNGDAKHIGDVLQVAEIFSNAMAKTHGAYLDEVYLEYPNSAKIIIEKKQQTMDSLQAFLKRNIENNVFRQDVDEVLLVNILEGIFLQLLRMGDTGDKLLQQLTKTFDYLLNGVIKR